MEILDTLVEEYPVLHDHFNLLDGQVYNLTNDLGSLGTDKMFDVLEKHGTNHVLVVRVLRNYGIEDLVARDEVALVDTQSLLRGYLLLSHLLLLHHLGVHWHIASHRVATVVVAHGTTGLVFLVVLTIWMLLIALRALLLLSKVGHGLEQHLQVVLDLFLVGEVSPLGVFNSPRRNLTDFLDLVMVDDESLVVDG